jgi:hypothetical protein
MGLFVASLTILIGLANLPAAAQSGRTFYIDYSSGSNSNNGTSKSSPWKTHPYMNHSGSCDGGNAPSYSHQAGDRFIFKGGVTWPAACFTLVVQQGGTSSAQDYYGVDQSWYNGSGWTRPLFNMAYTGTSDGPVIEAGNSTGASSCNSSSCGSQYITFDNLEIAHQLVTFSSGDGLATCGLAFSSSASGALNEATRIALENSFIHDWASNENFTNGGYWGGALNYCLGGVSGASIVDHTEISDAAGYAYIGATKYTEPFGGGCTACGEVRFSKIHDGWFGNQYRFYTDHDNEYYDIYEDDLATAPSTGNQHTHTIFHEQGIGYGGPYHAIYNDLIHDIDNIKGWCCGINIAGYYPTPVYNNVIYNVGYGGGLIRLSTPCNADHSSNCDSSSLVGYILNNTISCPTTVAPSGQYGGPCVQIDGTYPSGANSRGTLYLENNIYITDRGSANANISINAVHDSNNYQMGLSEARTYGFTSATVFAPTSSDSHVTGQGANLISLMTAAPNDALGPLAYDAQGAPWFSGSYVQRTSSWNLGAFQSGGQTASAKPSPPSNLIATVQ